jgi:hypothetical protein
LFFVVGICSLIRFIFFFLVLCLTRIPPSSFADYVSFMIVRIDSCFLARIYLRVTLSLCRLCASPPAHAIYVQQSAHMRLTSSGLTDCCCADGTAVTGAQLPRVPPNVARSRNFRFLGTQEECHCRSCPRHRSLEGGASSYCHHGAYSGVGGNPRSCQASSSAGRACE